MRSRFSRSSTMTIAARLIVLNSYGTFSLRSMSKSSRRSPNPCESPKPMSVLHSTNWRPCILRSLDARCDLSRTNYAFLPKRGGSCLTACVWVVRGHSFCEIISHRIMLCFVPQAVVVFPWGNSNPYFSQAANVTRKRSGVDRSVCTAPRILLIERCEPRLSNRQRSFRTNGKNNTD